jgi:hypothetical protein
MEGENKKLMNTRKLFALLVGVFAFAAAAATQGFWDKKEWKSWSADDCRKIQEDSPWSYRWELGGVQQDRWGQPTKGDSRQTEQHIFYIIQLRSALPVRQAVIRDAQLRNKYDSLSAADKQNFDASAEAFLARKYGDVIVVHVYYGSNVTMTQRDMMRFWQTNYPEGTVPAEAFLSTSTGKRVAAIRYVAAKGGSLEFELIFPRIQNGEPIVTSDVKSIGVEFQHPNIGTEGEARVYHDFKTEKMMLKGVLSF